jgi:crotonobetainyl-CoA:carnitine CoA-transferase CaiB-like acyl-CoA transferase
MSKINSSPASQSRPQPLQGLVVLDLTRFFPGAVATMILQRFGAEVIKIEQPGNGDPGRSVPGLSWLFAETNRGKKSLSVNLKHHRGKEVFSKLASTADIVVESFRPGVMTRLGLAYEELSQRNHRLIYAALSGYGQTGQFAGLAGHDLNYIAMSGLLELISPSMDCPVLPELQIADVAGGSLPVLIGILLAIRERDVTGRGQRVDVSMVGELAKLLTVPLAALRSSGRSLQRGKELLSGAYACYSAYCAKDNKWLVVGALEEKFWATLCKEIGRPDLIADQFSPEPRQSELKQTLSKIFLMRTADEWFALLRSHDCCVTPVRNLAEADSEGHFNSREFGIGSTGETRWHRCAPVPEVGEHSVEILTRFGVSKSDLEVLQKENVIS